MALDTIFSSPLGQTVLVFILVFTLLFALLQKSKILGDGKKQTDALISLAIALLVISVGYAMDIITTLVPFLAVGLVIILVFLLLWGSFYHGNLETSKGVKIAAGIVALIAVVVAVLFITGAWDFVRDWIVLGNSGAFGNIILIVIVIVAVVVVMNSSGEKKKE